jgi:uncharacterized SAM-binding protein YcdF (DUF218 family)
MVKLPKKTTRLIFLLAVLIVLLPILLTGMGAFLIVSTQLEPVDVIVVLSGDGGDRVEEAISLYQEGYGRLILLTETGETTFDPNVMVTQLKINRLVDAGIPEDAIRVSPATATSTYEEAQAVEQELAYYGWYSCIVVTGPYHTRRADLIFERVFEGSGIQVMVQAARQSWYHPCDWWLSGLGWRVTLHEYGALILALFGNQ